jgi:hypothetical protein
MSSTRYSIVSLERACQQLVLVARDLESALIALQLAHDALLGRGDEPAGRYLLAGVDLIARNEPCHLALARDGARHDAPPRHLARLQVDLCAWGAGDDVADGDHDADERAALLGVVPDIPDVEHGEHDRGSGERGCDGGVAGAVGHLPLSSR